MEQEELLLRHMEPGDVAACAQLEATVQDGWTQRGIAEALCAPAARCFVALRGGAVAGFAACTLVCDEATLDALSVLQSCRRQGVAQALLRHLCAALCAEGAQSIALEVRSQNAPAHALYERFGFVPVGLRRGFYTAPNDDAVLMRLSFCAASQ